MVSISQDHFPLLKRGHSAKLNVPKSYRGEVIMTCGAEDCMGSVNTNHAFTSRNAAAQAWIEERGLVEDVNVRVV